MLEGFKGVTLRHGRGVTQAESNVALHFLYSKPRLISASIQRDHRG
jgi:hypothetical protein